MPNLLHDMASPSSGASASSEQRRTNAKRLTFSYEGNQIELIGEQDIQKVVPPSFTGDTKDNRSGSWFEITGDKQNILYRQTIDNPIKTDVEVFSDEKETESISRHKISDVKGAFSIVIPDIPEAQGLELYGSPMKEEKGVRTLDIKKPSTKIFHLNLKNNK
jgi:hypothetical protein